MSEQRYDPITGQPIVENQQAPTPGLSEALRHSLTRLPAQASQAMDLLPDS